jgi:alpha-L-fucosidase 2
MKRVVAGCGAVLAWIGAVAAGGDGDLVLRYDQPSREWTDALPVGNGRLAAMVFGGVEQERLALNEDTLTSGEPPADLRSIRVRPRFAEVLAHLRAGRHREAEQIIGREWLGRNQACYQPLGDLLVDFPGTGPVTGYRRSLDLATAVATTEYERDGNRLRREVFASHPDRVVVLRLESARPGGLAFTARFRSPHPTAAGRADGADAVLRGQLPGYVGRRPLETVEQWGEQWKYPENFTPDGRRRPHAAQVLYGADIDGKGMFFEARLRILTDGTVRAGADGTVEVTQATRATLLVGAASSYAGPELSPSRAGRDPGPPARAAVEVAAGREFADLRARHVADHAALFDRVALTLGGGEDRRAWSTDRRLDAFADDGDPGLAALLFHYGRYLLIAGSREGSQPLNLQGKWNDLVIPPWASSYTLNINAQMNYWPAEVTGLSELHRPFFHLARELAAAGAATARDMYGARGWVTHHNSSLWRETYPVDGVPRAAFWNMAAPWIGAHLWQHWLFTGDERFLAETAYPLLRGAAEFCADWLVEEADGTLVTPVSTSPENAFLGPDGQPASVSLGATMDLALIREVFTHTIAAARHLGRDPGLVRELEAKRARLAPYRIGARGQLQEWREDYREADPRHRHVSHLYGVHPGNELTAERTPRLFAAARRSLDLRGDDASGWSMGWKINLWARLHDGDRAYRVIRTLFRRVETQNTSVRGGGLYRNLLDAHPPFQIDGNFGYTAGVAELLVQSHEGRIELLPALPAAWPHGEVRGLRTRGGFIVDVVWREGRLARARVVSTRGGHLRVRAAAPFTVDGRTAGPAAGENPNPSFALPPVPPFEDREAAPAAPAARPAGFVADLPTAPGEVFVLVPVTP